MNCPDSNDLIQLIFPWHFWALKGSGDKFVADQNRFVSNEIFNQLIL